MPPKFVEKYRSKQLDFENVIKIEVALNSDKLVDMLMHLSATMQDHSREFDRLHDLVATKDYVVEQVLHMKDQLSLAFDAKVKEVNSQITFIRDEQKKLNSRFDKMEQEQKAFENRLDHTVLRLESSFEARWKDQIETYGKMRQVMTEISSKAELVQNKLSNFFDLFSLKEQDVEKLLKEAAPSKPAAAATKSDKKVSVSSVPKEPTDTKQTQLLMRDLDAADRAKVNLLQRSPIFDVIFKGLATKADKENTDAEIAAVNEKISIMRDAVKNRIETVCEEKASVAVQKLIVPLKVEFTDALGTKADLEQTKKDLLKKADREEVTKKADNDVMLTMVGQMGDDMRSKLAQFDAWKKSIGEEIAALKLQKCNHLPPQRVPNEDDEDNFASARYRCLVCGSVEPKMRKMSLPTTAFNSHEYLPDIEREQEQQREPSSLNTTLNSISGLTKRSSVNIPNFKLSQILLRQGSISVEGKDGRVYRGAVPGLGQLLDEDIRNIQSLATSRTTISTNRTSDSRDSSPQKSSSRPKSAQVRRSQDGSAVSGGSPPKQRIPVPPISGLQKEKDHRRHSPETDQEPKTNLGKFVDEIARPSTASVRASQSVPASARAYHRDAG